MNFNRLILLTIVMTSVCCGQTPSNFDLIYDPATGNITVDGQLGNDFVFATLVSTSGIFSEGVARGTSSQTDHHVTFPIGNHLVGSTRNLGEFVPAGLSDEFLFGDLCFDTNDINSRQVTANINGMTFPARSMRCEIPQQNLIGDGLKTAVLHYRQEDGNISIDFSDDALATAIEITSPAGIFTGAPAQNLGNFFDIDSDFKIFKLNPNGISDINFGNVAETGLTANQLASSVCVDGAWHGGGALDIDLQIPNSGTIRLPTPQDDACGAGVGGGSIPADLNVAYNPDTGYFTVSVVDPESNGDAVALAATEKTKFLSLQINSESGIFVSPPEFLTGPNDSFSSNRIIKHDAEGFAELVFRDVLEPGLDFAFLQNDLSVDAITNTNVLLGDVSVVRQVPEPSSVFFVLLGFALVIRGREPCS